MRNRLVITIAGVLLLLAPAEAAVRELLAAYINSINSVVTILGKINNENDAKANASALETAIGAMKSAKAQLAAGSTNAAETEKAVKERVNDLQKSTAALHELTHRLRKNEGLSQILAPSMAQLGQ